MTDREKLAAISKQIKWFFAEQERGISMPISIIYDIQSILSTPLPPSSPDTDGADQMEYQSVFNKACAFYTEWAQGDSTTELMAAFAIAYASALTPPVPDQTVRVPKLKTMPRLNDTEYTERRTWNTLLSELRRLNPSSKFETI